MSRYRLSHGRGAGNRHQMPGHASSTPGTPAHGNAALQKTEHFTSHGAGSLLPVQNATFVPQHFPFQPLPAPNGSPPFRFDLSELLHPDEVQKTKDQIVGTYVSAPYAGEQSLAT